MASSSNATVDASLAAARLPSIVRVTMSELVKLEAEATNAVSAVARCQGGFEHLNACNSEARQSLQLIADKIVELERLAEEQDKETHKRLIEERILHAREQLQRDKKHMLRASREASNALHGASQVLAQQIKSSLETTRLLAESSNTLKDTKNEMHNFGGVVQTSKSLITKLGRREFTNNLLIILGLTLFALTCLYILKKRMAPTLALFSPLWSILGFFFGKSSSSSSSPQSSSKIVSTVMTTLISAMPSPVPLIEL